MPTFRKIVKDVAADWLVEEEGVVQGDDIATLADAERTAWEKKGALIEGGILHDSTPSFGERASFMVHGPGVGEKHQVVFLSHDDRVFL
jgi:hypothetical protein